MKILKQKGILGLDTVRVVIVTLLVLAVTTIAVFLALVSLQDSNIFSDSTFTNAESDESVLAVNLTGSLFGDNTQDNAVCAVSSAMNETGDVFIGAGNYTVVGSTCTITFTSPTDADASNFNNTAWIINSSTVYTDTNQAETDSNSIVNNITSGTTEFFANVPTYMVLLGVVVLLLIIAIVLVVVSRFATPDMSMGGGSEGLKGDL